MKHFGLIGKEVSHSLSPKIHTAIAALFGLELTYELFDVEKMELPKMIDKLKNGDYHGFNITMPYKTEIMQYLDGVSDKAKRMGAVNTVHLKEGLVLGDNTDYYGMKETIERSGIDVFGKAVYILGTGGAAKSGYVALEDLGAKPIVVRRKTDEVTELFKDVIYYEEMDPKVDILVNATPVGMYPHIGQAVLEKEQVVGKVVFDYIYNPEETLLMSYAKSAYNGLLTVFIQAFYSESLWQSKTVKFETEYLNFLKEAIKK